MRKMFWMGGAAALAAWMMVSCTKSPAPAAPAAPNASDAQAPQKPRKLNLAIWSNYVTPEQLKQIREKTGIEAAVTNYSSNEELLAKLQAGASGYDLIMPSDYMVYAMIQLKLVQKLDRAKIPNSSGIDARFLKKSFDATNEYSLPFGWGVTGMAVNKEKVKDAVRGWKHLFERKDLAGKFTLLDDAREVIGVGMKISGFSLNSVKADELAKAKALLLGVRSKVKGFTSEPMVALRNGETPVAQAYQSDALQAARDTGGKVDFVIPEEGATFYIDNWVIPSTAANVAEAHDFINALLEPKLAAQTVMVSLVAPTVPSVLDLLPAEIRGMPQLKLNDAVLAKLEMMQDLGDGLKQIDRIWTELKSSAE
jgi:spermidine/putrescine transport system substrate-binding protein